MRIISWNVAGIKARADEIKNLIHKYQPDIICLQKTRTDRIPSFDHYHHHTECSDRWSGVATYFRENLEATLIGHSTNYLALEFENFTLINAYVPYSNPHVPGYIERRKDWDRWIINFVIKQAKPVIICGDLNIVHTALDTSLEKYEQNTGCYYHWERDNFSRLLSECRLTDSFRYLHPHKRAYTYFDTMHGIDYRTLNQGSRLDYFLISESLMHLVSTSDILPPLSAPSNPIVLQLSLDGK